MGWSSGTEVAEQIIRRFRKIEKSAAQRRKLYRVIIEALRSADWDCEEECLDLGDPAYELAYKDLNPE
jgi:hypothetical protein